MPAVSAVPYALRNVPRSGSTMLTMVPVVPFVRLAIAAASICAISSAVNSRQRPPTRTEPLRSSRSWCPGRPPWWWPPLPWSWPSASVASLVVAGAAEPAPVVAATAVTVVVSAARGGDETDHGHHRDRCSPCSAHVSSQVRCCRHCAHRPCVRTTDLSRCASPATSFGGEDPVRHGGRSSAFAGRIHRRQRAR